MKGVSKRCFLLENQVMAEAGRVAGGKTERKAPAQSAPAPVRPRWPGFLFLQTHLTIQWQSSQRRDGNKPGTFWKTTGCTTDARGRRSN